MNRPSVSLSLIEGQAVHEALQILLTTPSKKVRLPNVRRRVMQAGQSVRGTRYVHYWRVECR